MAAREPLQGESEDPKIAAVRGRQSGADGTGVSGIAPGVGVYGQSTGPNGFSGVRGESTGGPGVSGGSVASVGVDAMTDHGPAALRAVSAGNGHGVLGASPHVGVFGHSTGTEGYAGVRGESTGGPGVSGGSVASVGVDAMTDHGPAALRAVHKNNGLAGEFGGDVHVSGNLLVDGDVQLKGGDVAEQFELVGALDAGPGTVVVIAGDDRVQVSERAYDRRVAGVIAGGGSYRPAIVLDRQPAAKRRALALTGKAYCKVDASDTPIEIGDLLTTSTRAGHAMAAVDPLQALGAVIGKALEPLPSGQGLIPILIALQ